MFFLRTFFSLVLAVVSVNAVWAGLAIAGAGDSGDSGSDRRAVVVFVPNRPGDLKLLNEAVSQGGFSVGLATPSIGRDVPVIQTYLDLGQGAAVNYLLYGPLPPDPARFTRFDGGIKAAAISGLKQRAADVPAKIRPGLLASTLEQSGIRVAYAYSPAAVNDMRGIPQALVAIDRRGVVRKVGRIGEIDSLLKSSRVIVSWLPADQVWRISRHISDDDLLVLIGVPNRDGNTNHALPVAVRGPGGEGTLSSATTRTKGLITVPDIASSVVGWFSIDEPDGFQGAKIDLNPGAKIDTLERLDGRLSVIEARRLPALAVLAAAILLTIALLTIVLGGRGVRLGVSVSSLTLFWLPAVLLLTAWLEPSAALEYLIVVAAALSLSFGTMLAVPARVAPLVAIGASLVATFVDLALGSQLTQLSLLGPNPVYGARFFGIGNELEGLLAASFLIGAGMMVDISGLRRRPLALLGMGMAFALALGWNKLGADVGGVLVVGAGAVVAAALVERNKSSARFALIALLAVVVTLTVVTVADLFSGGSHLTGQLEGAGGIDQTVLRRTELAFRSLTSPSTLAFAVAAALLLSVVMFKRKQLLAPIDGRQWAATRAGVAAAATATVIGFFVNDSGPVLLIGGTAEVALFIGYVWATPNKWNKSLRQP